MALATTRTAIVGGTIWTGDGAVIRDGVVVIDGDRIGAVGQGGVPKGAHEVSARGRYVLPGLVDAHTHLGLDPYGLGADQRDGNESSDPVTPQVRALDAFYPFDPALDAARAAGVSTARGTPGSGNVLSGESAVVHLVGRDPDAMALRQPAGIKAALGENPKAQYRTQRKMPTTRMATAALLREALARAAEVAVGRSGGEGDGADDPRWRALVPVVRREIPLRIHCHRADDILTALRIRAEFGIDITLEHATEGYLVADEIARAGVACMVGPALSGRYKVELAEKRLANPVVLHDAGVPVALITDHPVQQIDTLPWAAGLAVREGMPEQEALASVSLRPALSLGVAERVGSLAPGKLADVVVWRGHPFELRSRAERVYIGGELVVRG
jgi:imidazolonepropionase-like amidohydrolase